MLRFDQKPYNRAIVPAILIFVLLLALMLIDFRFVWVMNVFTLFFCAYILLRHRVILDDRHDSIYCATCRYDLRGSLQEQASLCPECGTAIPIDVPET